MSAETPAAPLTAKGSATRDRIVTVAGELIYRDGIAGTTNPAVRSAAGISGSQLSHYFPDKESLVRAVIAWRAGQVVALSRVSPSGELDSLSALRLWADFYTRREEAWQGGCRFGSLASEVLKSDLDLKDDVAAGFQRWKGIFRDGLAAMRAQGELRDDADPGRLASVLLAAFQGGMLLAQAERSVAPLSAALDGAIAYVSSFAADPRNQEERHD
jgi:TetR/AcrR family transcriptional regulator, transcriptional repressor for nem operon